MGIQSPDLTIPSLGDYLIIKEIQEDAFGILYLAQNQKTKESAIVRAISTEISNDENFIIRFEVLRSSLPKLQHQNLVQVHELGYDQNIYYIAKELPAPSEDKLLTLENFNLHDLANRNEILHHIFHGIAHALHAGEQFHSPLYKNGFIHKQLTPDKIYLYLEEGKAPIPKVDAYGERFLFFGDEAQAPLLWRMAPTLYNWKKIQHEDNPQIDLYQQEPWLSPHSRTGAAITPEDTQYSLGVLMYHTLTGTFPYPPCPPPSEKNCQIDPVWDEITTRCLSSLHGGGFKSTEELLEGFDKLSSQRKTPDPLQEKLQSLVPPPGMSLISIQDKVELGAKDGPLPEQPRFRARIEPFFIDVAPVTCKQMEAFMSQYRRSAYSQGDDHPATLVSWNMAKAYCRWRSEQEGIDPDKGYRLPTEHEWEAACRGSTGQQYPWGDRQNPRQLHCGQDKNTGSVPVKQFPPSRFGLYDLLGNVWEWTESPYKAHPFSEHHEEGYGNNLFVVKGGCWMTPIENCRASLRGAFSPRVDRGNIGFRCVLPIEF
ncbi:MAG: hypothetical protein CMO81_08370 [Waddliaceae bacterium]|nr:hypothetical protein [Waddliaceae bacterium]